MNTPGTHDEYVFTVGELNEQVKRLLEGEFPSILVSGEISNLSQPRSGHWYFTLKDTQGQIRAAMFKFRNQHCNFTPKEGEQVVARAKLSLYAPRGDYQLIVDTLQPAGLGALQAAYEALKQKLLDEGLFEVAHKKPLPTWPEGLCVITSGTGAALQDILHVLQRRFPALPITVIPVPVQGTASAPAIVRALRIADRLKGCDVILLARGGGSLEDLWSFNDERVARTIFRCIKPVVSGVGHETDFTISDFVADVRAPTPSAAAEIISPDQLHVKRLLQALMEQSIHHMHHYLKQQKHELALLRARMTHPREKLLEKQQTLDHLDLRLQQAWKMQQYAAENKIHRLTLRLNQHHPKHLVTQTTLKQQALQKRLYNAITQNLHHRKIGLKNLAHQAHLVSPLATLQRGYSITTQADNSVVRRADQIKLGDQIQTHLSAGKLVSIVSHITDATHHHDMGD
jgi:exodeoxyribonuclease VII large subunit